MRTFELGDLVAERQLMFEAGSGETKEVVVRVGRPIPDAPNRAWVCPYQVSGLGRDRVVGIFGADSMQALLLALHTIPAELSSFVRKLGGRFLHNGEPEVGFVRSCQFVVDLISSSPSDTDGDDGEAKD